MNPGMEGSIPARIERLFGPLPGQLEARAFSVFGLVAAVAACALSISFGFRGETFMGRPLGTDFVQFYAVGKVLNQGEPTRLYDVPFMARVQHESLPTMRPAQMLIYGSAPFLAQLFRPFAALPYRWAYCAWLAFSLAVYGTGLWLLFRNWYPDGYGRTAFLLSLSAPMYTFETWIGGQISVLAFLAFALFVRCLERRRLFLAGLALGLAAYKPSLIALPAAVIVLTGAWRMLGGLCVSTAAGILASLATVGAHGLRLWTEILRVYGYLATSPESVLHRTKYVDLTSFFAVLLNPHSFARIVALALTAAAFLVLMRTWWWASRHRPSGTHNYLWAATVAWTALLNVYVPVYDTIILVPAVALAARSVFRDNPERQSALQAWLVLLWVLSWLTQTFADFLRLQIFTLLLAGFGYWALTLARASSRPAAAAARESALALQQDHA